ncbi:MAG: sugar ABC transporter permease [Clostridiales bacterium]|nr:sugar ABC transporter permease [Clostridiales bacterium]
MGKKKINPRTLSEIKDFACVVPVLLFLAVFTYYPIIKLVQISFTDWNLLNDTWQYVGLKNWKWMFNGSGTKYLLNSLKVTILYSIGELSITIIGGMIFALIFNKMTKAFSLMRAIVFMPRYVAMSSAAVIFLWIFNTDSGILNYLLSLIGHEPVDWLGDRRTALISVLMLTGWRCIGYGMMIYLSAMMGIATDYYEAASLDGANAVQKFFKITLPLLSPTTLFLFITTFLSSMKVFQSVDILTQGGPYRSTEVFVYNIYRYAMVDFRMDRAATVGVFFFLLLLIVTVATLKISNSAVTYDSVVSSDL